MATLQRSSSFEKSRKFVVDGNKTEKKIGTLLTAYQSNFTGVLEVPIKKTDIFLRGFSDFVHGYIQLCWSIIDADARVDVIKERMTDVSIGGAVEAILGVFNGIQNLSTHLWDCVIPHLQHPATPHIRYCNEKEYFFAISNVSVTKFCHSVLYCLVYIFCKNFS